MVEKIDAAKEARQDDDFVLMIRTDAMRTGGYDEGARRANAYAKAGADLVMIFPNSMKEVSVRSDLQLPTSRVAN